MKNVFIIGSRGYTKNYGGWETFVHGLIDNWKDPSVHFYVFEISHNPNENEVIKEINGVTCITLYVKQTGSIAMIKFDYLSTKFGIKYVKDNNIESPVFFYLGLRIGPYIWLKKRKLKKSGIVLMENPAGLEWKRTKWNKLVQLYCYIAAKMMASSMDYLVCDNGGILDTYSKFRCCKRVKKTVIAYGTYPRPRINATIPDKVKDFYSKFDVAPREYYLVLGRLVPENNYDLMLSAMIKYKGNKKFLIICNVGKENKYYRKLFKKYNLEKNGHKIIFAGELYDKEMLPYVRQSSFAYIHGHSVGGTNPGLLEAMSNTDINILFDCPFNKEVGKDSALYFKCDEESLLEAFLKAEHFNKETIQNIGIAARTNMESFYSWPKICKQYSELFDTVLN